MSKPDVARIVKGAKLYVTQHSPEILTGFGIAGMITTTVLAVRATPKALRLIEERKQELGEDILSTAETVKACWRCYIPAAVTGAASMACLIGATSVSVRRNAALAAAYKLSETAMAEYKEKVIETIGEKKEKVVREKIAEDRLEKNPVNERSIVITDKGNTLCLEPVSGQYFRSDIDKIKAIVNNLNEQLLNDPFGYMSLNSFYDELGLEHTSQGEDLGWNVSRGIIRIDFHAKIAKNDEPCIVIDYLNAPEYGYDRLR